MKTLWPKLQLRIGKRGMSLSSILLAIAYFGVLMFLFFLYRVYMRRISAFGCFDDCFNIVAGYFLTKGKVLYSDIFFNHQMLMPYISAFLQSTFDPINIFDLLLVHRRFLFVFAFLFDTLLIFRYRWIGIGFVLFYEATKFYVFGDRFLAEGFIVYPLVYLFGLAWLSMVKKRVYLIDYLLSGLLAWFVVFMREPYIHLALALYGFLLWSGRSNRRSVVISLAIFFSLFVWILLSIPIKEYLFNIITANKIIIGQEVKTIGEIGILKIFGYPILIFLQGKWTFLRMLLIGLSSVLIILMTKSIIRYKQWRLILFVLFFLGIANVRYIEPGHMFYAAFHSIPWYGLFVFTILLLISANLQDKKQSLVTYSLLFFCLVLFIYAISPRSFIWERIDRHEELITNYGHYLGNGEAVRLLANKNNTLFVDGFDELIYWQAKLPSSYKYSWYTSFMPYIPKYEQERLSMFRESPPDFYYGQCPSEKWTARFIPIFKRNEYVQLLLNGKPTCLYIRKAVIPHITSDKWKKAEELGYRPRSKL